MNIAPTKWYDLGPYKVLQHPLAGNPYWSSYWIYRAGRLLGKLLSVPSVDDCQHVERWGDKYADSSWQPDDKTVRGRAKSRANGTRNSHQS